ncbi:MBL fold metallo-hydrolase [Verrucomicrobiaceae bacterium N1E253]|uniref:MBL fold metallo-hydrolase n=1 Tax=Oceaniferula marina TaxID=2748318 RepID=A0A851GJN1_9BACT|nr:MBL fold metallo-hydrolase [Oceaniferula marina]NWK57222.1 MBL fold metallo-hydrolase [Oceaniferula marina]
MTQDKTKAPQIPREDDICDVIGKAMRGQGLTPASLAQQASLPEPAVSRALQADGPALPVHELNAIASALGLNPKALAQLNTYLPGCQAPAGLITITTRFGHAGVNAFILENEHSAWVFDTGTDPSPILSHLSTHRLELKNLYITHGHHDHISGLPSFPEDQTILPENIRHGESRALTPNIRLTALETSGHFTPSRAYFIEGLSAPVCICGDILFAGSMGKASGLSSYQQSLRHARENLLSLPPETLLCPGHGPLSTIALEKQHNPFLA